MELDPQAYLDFYGYLAAAAGNAVEAVRLFQRHFGTLEQDGVLGPKTLRAMNVPRCGLGDHLEEASVVRKWPERDWQEKPLRYFIYGWVDGIPQDVQRQLHRGDWDAWEAVCNIKFVEVDSAREADITLGVGRGRADGFDGPGNTLAWAQLPNGRTDQRLDCKHDLDENWIWQSGRRGILFPNVGRHEKGHLLGISHHDVPNSLMNAFYSEGIGVPKPADIKEAQRRYGQPVAKPEDPAVPDDPDEWVTMKIQRKGLVLEGYRLLSK
jgi:hypothetical protein